VGRIADAGAASASLDWHREMPDTTRPMRTGLADGLGAFPPAQRAIHARCVHPGGRVVDFAPTDLEGTLPGRVARLAERHPTRPAVETDRRTLTYSALSRHAAGVAAFLRRRRAVGPEAVAVLMDDTAAAIWSALGVLAAGKICVPLDPALPRARTAFILQDSGATVVLTDAAGAAAVRDAGHPAVVVDEIAEEDPAAVGDASTGQDIAYLLYTSGSTGQPKGVVRTHSSQLHFEMNYARSLHICAEDRAALLRSASVSGGVRDTYAALLNGAALCVPDLARDGIAALPAWLREREITFAFFAAPLFRLFVEQLPGAAPLPRLRAVRLGSDTVQKSDVERYQRHLGASCVLVTGFSSSETGTVCKFFVDGRTAIDTPTVPVGYPVHDVRVFLLGPDGREVERGEVGEIAVQSPSLAEGYWRRPHLTAAAFRPGPGSGERVYLTGSLGRQLADGCLEHLGRKDFHARIRGHGVELAEVERALVDLAHVRDAAVIAQPGPSGDTRLVAYVVPTPGSELLVSALRAALARSLPDYMIPAEFVPLSALPLTPTNKVDRSALPRAGRTRPLIDAPFVSPRTPIETTLARLWAEVLGLDRVGMHDPFFELGGDSLLAARVVSRAVDALGVDVPVAQLLDAHTVAAMALVVLRRGVESRPVGPTPGAEPGRGAASE